MSRLALLLIALLVAGCATVDRPKPLTGAEIVELAKSGASAKQIVAELQRTDTVLMLSASDFVRLHQAGVPNEVLDYLQQQLILEMRWRDRWAQMNMYGPLYRGYGPCPWNPRWGRPYGPWGC